MSKEKQIEEMAKAMCGNGMPNGYCARDDEPCGLECVYGYCAERLYCKGYRKQSNILKEIIDLIELRMAQCKEHVRVLLQSFGQVFTKVKNMLIEISKRLSNINLERK